MFLEKSKGETLFGIYSIEDDTLLYVSRKKTAAKEFAFVDLLSKEYENGYATNRSTEEVRALIEELRMQQIADHSNGNATVPSRRYAGNGGVYGRQYERYPSPALRNVLENIFEKETD